MLLATLARLAWSYDRVKVLRRLGPSFGCGLLLLESGLWRGALSVDAPLTKPTYGVQYEPVRCRFIEHGSSFLVLTVAPPSP